MNVSDSEQVAKLRALRLEYAAFSSFERHLEAHAILPEADPSRPTSLRGCCEQRECCARKIGGSARRAVVAQVVLETKLLVGFHVSAFVLRSYAFSLLIKPMPRPSWSRYTMIAIAFAWIMLHAVSSCHPQSTGGANERRRQ